MKLSYTTLSVQDKTIEEAVRLAEKWGLSGIELRGRVHSHAGPGDSFSYLSYVKKLIQHAGLEIPCLTAYTKFYQPDMEGVLCQVEELLKMVELAEFLEARTVRTFMGASPVQMISEKVLDQTKVGLELVAQRMGNTPVNVVIETHDSAKDGRTMAKILSGISPKIGVLLDIIHPFDRGESIEDTWKAVGDRIYHVHIKDIVDTVVGGRVYCPIGTGVLPVEKTMRFLADHGYSGFFSLEWEKSAPGYSGVSLERQMESFLDMAERIGGTDE